jgi:hypothetical protein
VVFGILQSMHDKEFFISNEARDQRVPEDVVTIINGLRQLPHTETITQEDRYAVDDALLFGARALQKTYGRAVKFSYVWHLLAGSSVEHGGETPHPDLVREIDDAVCTYVREILAPLYEHYMGV